ncbi:MAG: hypothetical protein E7576_16865 [Ruminococcaceae bacterium]|jgi:hypothetical protein|nr:hypothetical protein [Oscillospiraceae bacterium]
MTEIPENFPYRETLLRGRPEHRDDGFWEEHPRMERGKRAKLFAPFDALDGYGDAIRTKNTVYTEKPRLSTDQQEALNRRLTRLCEQFGKRRRIRDGGGGLPWVRVTRYVPCSDRYHDAYGRRGTCETAEGWLTAADPEVARTICVNGETIPFGDIVRIQKSRPFR